MLGPVRQLVSELTVTIGGVAGGGTVLVGIPEAACCVAAWIVCTASVSASLRSTCCAGCEGCTGALTPMLQASIAKARMPNAAKNFLIGFIASPLFDICRSEERRVGKECRS